MTGVTHHLGQYIGLTVNRSESTLDDAASGPQASDRAPARAGHARKG
jgi:hypothetical protein